MNDLLIYSYNTYSLYEPVTEVSINICMFIDLSVSVLGAFVYVRVASVCVCDVKSED